MSNLHSRCKTEQIKRYQSPDAMVTKYPLKAVISQTLSDFNENQYTCSVFSPEQEYVKKVLKIEII